MKRCAKGGFRPALRIWGARSEDSGRRHWIPPDKSFKITA
jgi:hypothetical protein